MAMNLIEIIIGDITHQKLELINIEQEKREENERKTEIILTKGGVAKPEGPYIVQEGEYRNHKQVIFRNEKLAVQHFLQQAEQREAEEGNVLRKIASIETRINGDSILGEITTESRKKRAEDVSRLIKYIGGTKYDSQHKIKNCHEMGSKRNTNESETCAKRVKKIIDEELLTKNCYYTSYHIVKRLLEEREFEVIVYGEGIATPKYGGIPVLHAWVEINGSVIDGCWKWTGMDPDNMAIYYGKTFDWRIVKERMNKRNEYGSIIGNIRGESKGEREI